MITELSAPIDVQIEITEACNQRCRYCYNFWRDKETLKREERYFPFRMLSRVTEELSINKVPSITITGGEPFLGKRVLFGFLKWAKREKVRVSINTNFSVATEEDIEAIAGEYPVSILVSLLSADPKQHEHLTSSSRGTHSRVISLIVFALEKKIPISINMVLMRSNISGIVKLAELAKKLGVKTFCATKVLPNINNRDISFLLTRDEVLWSLEKLLEIEQTLGVNVDILGCYPKCLTTNSVEIYHRFFSRLCLAGRTTVTIGSDGQVRPCSHIDLTYGNIFSEPLSEIWKRMLPWRHNEFLPYICNQCQIVDYCTGGCRINSDCSGIDGVDIYAEPSKINEISEEQLHPRALDYAIKYPYVIVHPDTEFRDESFGACVFRRGKWATILINKKAASFLRRQRNSVFSFEEFVQESGAKSTSNIEKVEKLYCKLIHKGVLVPFSPNEERR